MAVIDAIPGIKVTVEVDGVALKEYEDKDAEEPANTVTRYIEAARGKGFAVVVKMKRRFKLESDALSFQVYADGNLADRQLFDKEDARTGHKVKIEGFDNHRQIHKFRFDALETVSDGRLMKEEASKADGLGTLKVTMYHSEITGRGPATVRAPPTSVGMISEKALKGKAVTHSVGLGDVVEKKSKTVTKTSRVSDVVTFSFRYHSLEALKSMLIIPRTPTPPPIEKKNFEDLSAEELRELHRRAVASATEAEEREETQRKIKRERADDNPRPRKISRPSAGDTQLELDDDGGFQESSTAGLGQKEQEIVELE